MPINYEKADREVGLANVAKTAGIQRVEVLHGHTTQDTAYVQPDYPYGRTDRCQRRVWLEQAVKGSAKGQRRLVTQTSNPKVPGADRLVPANGRLVWNKPHPATYAHWAVLLRLPDNPIDSDDFLSWRGFGVWGPDPDEDVWFHVSGAYGQLTEAERSEYALYLKLSRKGGSTQWERWDSEIIPAVLAYHAERNAESYHAVHDDQWPGPGDIKPYLPDHEYPAAVAAAILSPYKEGAL